MSPSGHTPAPLHEATHVLGCRSQVFGACNHIHKHCFADNDPSAIADTGTGEPRLNNWATCPVDADLTRDALLIRSAKTYRADAISTAIWVTNATFTRVINTTRVCAPTDVAKAKSTICETVTDAPGITIVCHKTTLTHLRAKSRLLIALPIASANGSADHTAAGGTDGVNTDFTRTTRRAIITAGNDAPIGLYITYRTRLANLRVLLTAGHTRTLNADFAEGADAIVVVDTPWRCFTLSRHWTAHTAGTIEVVKTPIDA